jgi:hypothetical protein
MRRLTRLQLVLSFVAVCGLIMPPGALGAEPFEANRPTGPAPAAAETLILDVALQPGGVLTGQSLNQTGQPLVNSQVLVLRQGTVATTATTNQAGQFTIQGLSGGVYEIRGQESSTVCRLWAPHTAPPSAKTNVLVTSDEALIRGQSGRYRRPGGILKGPLPWMVAVAAIITVPTVLALNLKPSS